MRCIVPILLLLALTSPVFAAPPDASVDAALADLKQATAGVESLQSDFVQEKHLAIFKETLLANGKFHFIRPDRLRWEVLTPVRTGFVLRGGEGRRWHERTGRSEPFSIDRDPVMKIVAEQLFAWAGGDFDRLRRQYAISLIAPSPVTLRLVPLAADRFLDHLQVTFAPDRRHVTVVELHEQGGDFTRIRFRNAAVNARLPEDLFR
jgi:outer membrane lipoprotein-sorting protein